MDTFAIIMAMLIAVMLSGVIVRVLPVSVPAPFVQIALGFVISAVFQRGVLIDPEIFFLLFLPPLLFLDGWRVSKHSVVKESSSIVQLAIGLVFLTVFGVGYLIHWMIPAIPLAVSFAIAAIVSPTDPVAVGAIARRVHIPRRMMAILEGEALFNDASGLVAFRFAVAAALTGSFSLPHATLTFFWMALAGIGVGVGLTAAIMYCRRVVGRRFSMEAGSDVLLSLLMPFFVYFVAEHAQASGILAAVAAGITMSYFEMAGGLPAAVRLERHTVWNVVQLTLNGMMFVLLGEQLPAIWDGVSDALGESGQQHLYWLPIYGLVICVGLMLMRFLWIVVSLKLGEYWARRRGQERPKIGRRLIVAMSVAGVRGAVTLAGVMTLPFALPDGSPFPARELAICLAAIVLLFSLVIASVSLPPLLRNMQFPANQNLLQQRELIQDTIYQAGREALQKTSQRLSAEHPDEGPLFASVAEDLSKLLQRRIGHDTGESTPMQLARYREVERKMHLEAVAAARQAVYHLALRHRISDELAREQVRLLDMQEARILADD